MSFVDTIVFIIIVSSVLIIIGQIRPFRRIRQVIERVNLQDEALMSLPPSMGGPQPKSASPLWQSDRDTGARWNWFRAWV